MSFLQEQLLLAGILIFSCIEVVISSNNGNYMPPNLTHLTDFFPHRPFNQVFSEFFGGGNIRIAGDGSQAELLLNKSSGSGFVSKDKYYYGFFSAAIKLPSGYTSGVVVAFYMSNGDVFPHNHDEIDFELLGHEKRKEWILQTNIYGNGSVSTGREEKFRLWFDPTAQFHRYSVIWNTHHIVFLVDNIPVREVNHSEVMSRFYPSKPMSLYATIWDGSRWATHGGKYPVNYKFGPFAASFGEMEMEGCTWNPTRSVPLICNGGQKVLSSVDPVEGEEFVKLSQQQKMGMEWARNRFMFYSYCKDPGRFSVLPPECNRRSQDEMGMKS